MIRFLTIIGLIAAFIISCGFIKMKQDTMPKTTIYLIPGQGSDYRIFKNIQLDSSRFDVVNINWILPYKKETMTQFAKRIAEQIDTTNNFSIVGVSLGGMIATELNSILNPKQVILISSAKSRAELPSQYKFQKVVPIHKLVPKKLIKKGALWLQPIYEKDRKLENETCDSMLLAKDPLFLKRTVNMIVNWERKEIDSSIIHIHGDNDNTLPIKNITCDYTIQGGSHMMTLTKGNELSTLLNNLLKNEKHRE